LFIPPFQQAQELGEYQGEMAEWMVDATLLPLFFAQNTNLNAAKKRAQGNHHPCYVLHGESHRPVLVSVLT